MLGFSTFLVLLVVSPLSASEDPPLPTLPNQYYLKVEGNLNEKYTVYLEEFYDGPGNRGAAITFRNNQTYWVTYDYEDLQQVTVTWGDDGKPICMVSNLTEHGFNIIGFHTEGGRPVIDSSAKMFQFGEEYNETYVGEDVVRGIPVNRWVRTIPHPGGAVVDLNYYFSLPGYHSATNGSQVPVRAILNGTLPNWNGTNGSHPVSHIYEFLDIHVEPPHGWWSNVFKPPLGLTCPGRRSRKELPRLPEIFSTRWEMTTKMGEYIHVQTMAFFYSYPGNMTSYFYHPRSVVNPRQPLWKTVHDFNYGLTFKIDEGSGVCNVSALNVSSYFHPDYVIAGDGSHVYIQNPTDTFIEPDRTWVYEGTSEMRDLEVESWISEPYSRNGSNSTIEIFFASINYSAGGFPSYVTHFPVRKTVWFSFLREDKIIKGEVVLDLFGFGHEIAGPWKFDTSQCFEEDNQKPLSFDLEGEDNFKNYVQNNTINFYHGVHGSIANATGLPGSRVTHVVAEEGSDEVLKIFVTLLGVPRVQGNALNSTQSHSLPLDKAVEKLRTAIDDGTFTVNFTQGEKMMQVAVVKGSLQENFSEQSGGVSLGVAIGIAVLTLVVGAALGALVMGYVQSKYNFKIPYLVQE